MQAYYMKNLTVKTKQKNLIMKMQRYLGLTMQCMGWLCFLKIYRRKMKDTSEKVRSGWQGNRESYLIAVSYTHLDVYKRQYEYFNERGYATVLCGGLGTRDSEGFTLTGSREEILAFKAVIDWLLSLIHI